MQKLKEFAAFLSRNFLSIFQTSFFQVILQYSSNNDLLDARHTFQLCSFCVVSLEVRVEGGDEVNPLPCGLHLFLPKS